MQMGEGTIRTQNKKIQKTVITRFDAKKNTKVFDFLITQKKTHLTY